MRCPQEDYPTYLPRKPWVDKVRASVKRFEKSVFKQNPTQTITNKDDPSRFLSKELVTE